MSLKDVSDWSHLLDSSCLIPTDILFNVKEKVTNEDGTVQQVWTDSIEKCFRSSLMVIRFQVSSGTVECHKLLLAVANPVFKSLFHGPIMMNGKKVKVNVQGTTYEAFSSLIKFIYSSPDYLPHTTDVQKMNDILNIAERYQVLQLAQEVQTVIARLHIKIESDIGETIKVENTLF